MYFTSLLLVICVIISSVLFSPRSCVDINGEEVQRQILLSARSQKVNELLDCVYELKTMSR